MAQVHGAPPEDHPDTDMTTALGSAGLGRTILQDTDNNKTALWMALGEVAPLLGSATCPKEGSW